MASYARKKRPSPPPELIHAFYTRDYGAPFDGGWLSWPAGYIAKIRLVGRVYNSVKAFSAHPNDAEWLKKNETAWEDSLLLEDIGRGLVPYICLSDFDVNSEIRRIRGYA